MEYIYEELDVGCPKMEGNIWQYRQCLYHFQIVGKISVVKYEKMHDHLCTL